jgi:hypothetical protein
MQGVSHPDLTLQMMTKTPKGVMGRSEKRTSVRSSTLRGADAHREEGLGMEMMMGTMMGVTLMTVTANSSEE